LSEIRRMKNEEMLRTLCLAIAVREFKQRFSEADLILAKGQGNFKTLSDTPGNIVFLFMAKCPVIASHAGVPIGTYVLVLTNAGNSNRGGEP